MSRDALFDALDARPEQKLTFAELMILIHTTRYTGALTLHFFSGTANSAELPRDPVQIRLDSHLPLDSGK